MAEKYVVVTKKGKTGELSKETAQRVAAEIGGGAQVVPAEVAKTLESKPVDNPSLAGAFFPRWAFLTILVIISGVAFDMEWFVIGFVWILTSSALAAFMSILRG
jgi:hypothetical protein